METPREVAVNAKVASDAKRTEVLQRLRQQKHSAQVVVPTDDAKVKEELRAMGEPITLFGENNHFRRERLKGLKQQLFEATGGSGVPSPVPQGSGGDTLDAEEDKEYFTRGSDDLLRFRQQLVKDSFAAAATRVPKLKEEFSQWRSATKLLPAEVINPTTAAEKTANAEREAKLKEMVLVSTAILRDAVKPIRCTLSVLGIGRPAAMGSAHVRPFTGIDVLIAAEENRIVTGSEDGSVSVWRSTSGEALSTTVVPTLSRVSGVAVHSSTRVVAAASRDCNSYVWRLAPGGDTPVADKPLCLEGHLGPVQRCAFLPVGTAPILATTSEDMTWRLWDIEKGMTTTTSSTDFATLSPLLSQGGHNIKHGRNVHALSWHPDGSLLTTTDFSGQALTWDVRSGKMVWMLPSSHTGKCTAAQWHYGGVKLATGGEDQEVSLWDLRMKGRLVRLAAHSDLVSSIQFMPSPSTSPGGSSPPVPAVMITGSLDATVRLWDSDTGSLLRTVYGHGGPLRQIVVDPAAPEKLAVFTVAKDRYWRRWMAAGSEVEAVTVSTAAAKQAMVATRAAPSVAVAGPQDTADAVDSDSDDDLAALMVTKKK